MNKNNSQAVVRARTGLGGDRVEEEEDGLRMWTERDEEEEGRRRGGCSCAVDVNK